MIIDKNSVLFEEIKDKLLNLDPVRFCEQYLMLDGKPFSLAGGYRPFRDVYRFIGVKALERNSKPIVILKARQVGMTTCCAALECYFMCSGLFGNSKNPPIRVIHAFPQLELAYAFSKTKLNPMINGSISIESSKKGKPGRSYMQSMLDTTSESNNSLNFKQFLGSSHIWIESTGIDGDRLRGRSADVIFFDEVQDTNPAAIGNVTKMLTKAQYGRLGEGVQVYFGTPKQRGSEFAQMWHRSSQQYFHLRCEKCDELFPLYTPGSDDWEKIWLYGYTVKCVKCNHEQDKIKATENGKWVATRNLDDCQFVGFHMSQLFIPEFTKEKIISEKPGNSPINSERIYQNEVLGEFFSGETGIMTPDDIREKCGDVGRKFAAHIPPGGNPVFIGIDIGAKADMEQLADSRKAKSGGQSYSTAVVLELTGHNRLEIQFASKFKRNDFASKKEFTDHLMRMYSSTLAVCDIGYANDFCELMQNEYGVRFLASQSSPRVNEHVKFNEDVFPKVITFEKDFYITELYEQMKKGHIRFPYGDYEKIAWLVQHCTSMEIKPTINRIGEATPHYVKGSMQNDGFMALLNGYLAYKWWVSKGFTIKNPMQFGNVFSSKKGAMRIPAYSVNVKKSR